MLFLVRESFLSLCFAIKKRAFLLIGSYKSHSFKIGTFASLPKGFRPFALAFFGIWSTIILAPQEEARATDQATNQATIKATKVVLYNYHQSPPFVLGPQKGLSYDFVEYLNRRGQGRYSFSLIHLPRKRLDKLLKVGRKGIVLWATPNWFGDPERRRFGWTKPVMQDGNVFISPRNRPVDVERLYNLNNLLIGGILGYRYKDVDAQVSKGLAKRTDVMGERALIRLVSQGRVDVGIMAQSAAKYLVREIGIEEKVYFGSQKHSVYARRLLIQGEMPRLIKFLNEIIVQMEPDPEWIAIMERYNLSPAITCLSPQESKPSGEATTIQSQGCPVIDDQDKYLMGENASEVKNNS